MTWQTQPIRGFEISGISSGLISIRYLERETTFSRSCREEFLRRVSVEYCIVRAARFMVMPFGDIRRKIEQSLIYDWAMRCPIAGYSAFVLYRDVAAFLQQALHDPGLFEHPDGGVIIAAMARISQWMFVVLLSIQPLFRLRPVAKSERMLPRAVALVAVCIPLVFLSIERAPPDLAFNLAAATVSLFANVMAVVTVSFLGRSLSVMPEARRLVQSGPYGIVRHPLYLCETLGTAAVALQYRSPAAAGLLLLTIALQAARGYWEEDVLARTFPDFAAYRSRTSFVIPRSPLRFAASFVTDLGTRRRLALVLASLVAVLALATVLPRLII